MAQEDESISLVPGATEEDLGRKKSRTFYGISIIIIILAALVYGILWYYHQTIEKNIGNIETQIEAEQKKIDEMGKEVNKFLSFKKRLDSLDKILKERAVLWPSFLNELGNLTVTGVNYNSLNIDRDGKVSLSGEAASAGDIARLLVSLKDTPPENNTPFSSVKLTSPVSYGDEKVSFILQLTLKKGVLQRKN